MSTWYTWYKEKYSHYQLPWNKYLCCKSPALQADVRAGGPGKWGRDTTQYVVTTVTRSTPSANWRAYYLITKFDLTNGRHPHIDIHIQFIKIPYLSCLYSISILIFVLSYVEYQHSRNTPFCNPRNITQCSLLLTDATCCLRVSPTTPDITQWSTSCEG